ncbi:carbohydrate sulfotransferase 4 [Sorex araneus]|uniref:carbohydrate sulfotransferase 4 n=1 Tax=Sorex araneus TaxID=42254 RepID=UPI0024334F70|nr:carbohydrate sulfotransferase 4 [Sorex araneus]
MAVPRRAMLLLFLLCLLALGVRLLVRYTHGSHSPPASARLQPTHVLVLSSWRSGSTLVGQLFGQHPDVFYLMEPVWHVWMSFPGSSAHRLQMATRDLVRAVFLCDMSVFEAYVESGRANGSGLFLWERSPALCAPPACSLFSRDQIIPASFCKLVCRPRAPRVVAEACRAYSHVVLKEVRVLGLRALAPLLRDPALNLRILHLVRDPRAVFHSRATLSGELENDDRIVLGARWQAAAPAERPYWVLRAVCRGHLDVFRAAQAWPPALRQRYLLARYEDLVREPLAQTARMYGFAGLEFLPRLQSWVYNITRGQGLGSSPFDVDARNAQRVSQAWRRALPFEKVARIQDVCLQTMGTLGYRLAASEQEQRNLSLDLLAPGPPSQPAHQRLRHLSSQGLSLRPAH